MWLMRSISATFAGSRVKSQESRVEGPESRVQSRGSRVKSPESRVKSRGSRVKSRGDSRRVGGVAGFAPGSVGGSVDIQVSLG